MEDTIESVVTEYLLQKECREAIKLDAEGKYKGFPVEEVKAEILNLFSQIGDISNMSFDEISERLPSGYTESISPSIQSLSSLQRSYIYDNLEIILNNDFQISSEDLIAEISREPLYLLGDSNLLRKDSAVLDIFKIQIEVLKSYTNDQAIIDIFNASEQFLLNRLNQLPKDGLEYKLIIQQIASSLGDCTTPVNQLLFSVALQLPPKIRNGLSSSKMEEIQQRVAFKHAITRELRQQVSKIYDLAEFVEKQSTFLFSRGAYDFNIEREASSFRRTDTEHLRALNIVNEEGIINVRNLYNFIKRDLLSLQQNTDRKTFLFNNALDRVQKAIYEKIETNRETFSLEYLKPENEQFYLISPSKIAEHFESTFRVWSNGLRSSSLNEKTVNRFTRNYIKQRLKEIKGFIKNQPQETAFETAMTTSRASLNPNVSTSGGGSAQALPGLSLNQAQGGGRNIRRGLS